MSRAANSPTPQNAQSTAPTNQTIRRCPYDNNLQDHRDRSTSSSEFRLSYRSCNNRTRVVLRAPRGLQESYPINYVLFQFRNILYIAKSKFFKMERNKTNTIGRKIASDARPLEQTSEEESSLRSQRLTVLDDLITGEWTGSEGLPLSQINASSRAPRSIKSKRRAGLRTQIKC